MESSEKPIRLSGHARQQLASRGATEAEIIAAIRDANWVAAGRNRLEARKDFTFRAMWNGKYYETKQVRPIFAEESQHLVVVTVYVYFF